MLKSESYADAFGIIDTKIWGDPLTTIWYTLFAPLFSVFAYLYAVPVLEREAVKLWANGKVRVQQARLAIEEGAPLESGSIEHYKNIISDLNSNFEQRHSSLMEANSTEMAALKREVEFMRNRVVDSLIPESDMRNILQSLDELCRDILWVANKIQGAPNNNIDSNKLLIAIKSIRNEVTDREISQAVYTLSVYGFIRQDFRGPTLHANISLGARGSDVAKKMEFLGVSPKQDREVKEAHHPR